MTLLEFRILPQEEKARVIWHHGSYVAEQSDDVFKYILYQVKEFYAEVFYHLETDEIAIIRGFGESSGLLRKYLNDIDVSGI